MIFFRSPILANYGSIEIRIRGLEFMNDDPHAVDVLYAKVESEALQQIADQLMQRFISSGLVQRKYDRVKLHITLINSLFRDNTSGAMAAGEEEPRSSRVTFDATTILREFGHYDFGSQKVTDIHLSQRYSTACDGYYEATGQIKL